MKYTIHKPVEQFGFIEVKYEGDCAGAIQEYRELTETMKVQPQGFSDKDFRGLYDKVASGQPVQGDPGMLEQLSPMQRFALKQAQLFVKRNNK